MSPSGMASASTTRALTRRTFLGGMSALILAHCGEDEPHARLSGGTGGTGGLDGGIDSGVDAKPDAGSDAGIETPFDAWRLLRDAANASPDNLPAQAQRLILSKDAEAIFRFVRDNIRRE